MGIIPLQYTKLIQKDKRKRNKLKQKKQEIREEE